LNASNRTEVPTRQGGKGESEKKVERHLWRKNKDRDAWSGGNKGSNGNGVSWSTKEEGKREINGKESAMIKRRA